jgi:hypothetical protein
LIQGLIVLIRIGLVGRRLHDHDSEELAVVTC